MAAEISVILPIYNVENYLARCLDSILCQTYRDFEILCVDDCGTDRSMEILREYQERYPDRIRCIKSEQNAGLGGARDKGIAAAKGDYIAFVDSDDSINEDYLATYIGAAQQTGADIVAGGYSRITGQNRASFPGRPEDPWYCWVNVSAWAKVFRTAFLRKNGIDFRGIRTYEDAPFLFRCLSFGPKTAVIQYDGYQYYQNPGSITTSQGKSRIHLYSAYSRNLISMYRETVFREEDREILTYAIASQLITNLLFNGQHAGAGRMKKEWSGLDQFLRELDPDLRKNRFVSRSIPLSEPALNKSAAWIVLKLRRFGLDGAVFRCVSLLPKMR